MEGDRQALHEQINDLGQMTALANQTITAMVCMVEKHERLLRGNGDIGMVAGLKHIAPMVEELYKIMKGKDDKPRIVARMASLEGVSLALRRPM